MNMSVTAVILAKAYDIIKLAAYAVRYKQTNAVINLIIYQYFLKLSAANDNDSRRFR